MKKLLLIIGLLWSAVSSAQFTPGQILTAAELNSQFALYAPLTGASFTGPITAVGITGTPISGSTGSFTNLSASGTVSFPSGTITPGSLAAQAANTVLANVTASSASPTAVAMPSCSTTTSALQYTSGTGFSCGAGFALLSGAAFSGTVTAPTLVSTGNILGPAAGYSIATVTGAGSGGAIQLFDGTHGSNVSILNGGSNVAQFTSTGMSATGITSTPISGSTGSFTTLAASSTVSGAGFTSLLAPYATLASPTFTGTVSVPALTASSTITPSQTAGIVGTTTNNNANAGSVGEYQTVTGGSAALVSGTNTNMTSVSLTAGDWDAECQVAYTPGVGTVMTGYVATVSTTSSVASSLGFSEAIGGVSLTTSFGMGIAASPPVRFSLSSTTTVFCVGVAVFGGGTLNAQGLIRARRVR